MLFREWSLYESIKFSDYVCTKLKLWTEPGIKNLQLFLTKIGLPKEEYNQKYKFMSKKYKENLSKLIMDKMSDFGLNEIYFTTYIR